MEDESPLFCARCAAELQPGSGNLYQITIEAVADPAPPQINDHDDPRRLRRGIDELLEDMKDLTAQEAQDQVYRRIILHLCVACYRDWIENPAGS